MDICYVVESGLSKKDAVASAKDLREQGYSVRVLKRKDSYTVIDCGNDDAESGTSTLKLGIGAAVVAGAGYLIGKAK